MAVGETFNSRLISVQDNETELWGFVNIEGECVIKPQFKHAGSFEENGLICVRDPESEMYGFIDEKGVFVIEPRFKEVGAFCEVQPAEAEE
jgi:hypothetical protein